MEGQAIAFGNMQWAIQSTALIPPFEKCGGKAMQYAMAITKIIENA
ncbi:MAG: hypothetical protein ABIQ11_03230 [Saprospiraceae bacterium]